MDAFAALPVWRDEAFTVALAVLFAFEVVL